MLEKVLIVIYFVPVMIIGISGNAWVALMLIRILYKGWNSMNHVFKHMLLYILSLAIADLLVLSMGPMVMSYFVSGTWKFGHWGCKIYFAIENVNKLLSVAILTLLSIERYVVICKPFGDTIFCGSDRNKYSSVLVLVILVIVIVLLCYPIIRYATTSDLFILQPNGMKLFSATVCTSLLPGELMSIFIAYMFILGFFVPMIVIFMCYLLLIRYLRRNDGQRLFVSKYTKKVTKSVRSVVLFHFACWILFWVFVCIPFLNSLFEYDFLSSDFFQTSRMISSLLPYLNSSCNWIFYTRAIRHARKSSFTHLRPNNSGRYR